jgi:hypothetical protein
MSDHPLDDPQIINSLFYVRKTPPHSNPHEQVHDGTVAVDGAEIGYRLYVHQPDTPLLLYFHGNGEIASDYDDIAPYYFLCGVSLLVVDYRGYGWSTDTPKVSKMLPDAEAVLNALPDIREEHGIESETVFVKGRSLGSAPAVYLAMKHGEALNGLIIESGYADAPSLFRRLGITIPAEYREDDTLPVQNKRKMADVDLPLLVIHGADDTLIPPQHGRDLYEASPAHNKELLIIDGAGHNNLLSKGTAKYFDAIKRFVKNYAG